MHYNNELVMTLISLIPSLKCEICFHHPSLWTWVKVYQSRDNNVIIHLERNVWKMSELCFSIILR